MLLFMFSYAGIPPLAGFFAKFYVFTAAVDAHFYILAVLGVLASVVGAYYYLRLIKIMYFDEPVTAFDTEASPSLTAVVLVFLRRDVAAVCRAGLSGGSGRAGGPGACSRMKPA